MKIGLLILIVVVAVLLLIWFKRKFKALKLPNVYLISGAVKSGKSVMSVGLAVKQYKKNLLHYRIKYVFCYILHKPLPMQPMLYSNIKLRYVKHNMLTLDIIKRRVRIPDKSVVLIDEASLLADSMLYKDNEINKQLMLFVKLFAHYTHGGSLIVNTQSISDLHFAFKRCVGQYLYIANKKKYPFISVFGCREMLYSEDNTINAVNEDTDLSLRNVFLFNRYYKYYDCYCYSIFTDNLTLYADYEAVVLGKNDSLKTDTLVSLQDFYTLGVDYENKENK